MRILRVLLFCASGFLGIVAFPGSSHAQNWQTWHHEFRGDIGGHKVTGWLLNRFGSLQGGYYYDKYAAEREAMGPREDTFTIYLEGKQDGANINLNEMCWLCKGVPDPELFTGTLKGNTLRGKWQRTHRKGKVLDFSLVLSSDTSRFNTPPKDPDNFAQYDNKDIWSSGFFSSKKVQRELKRTMGKDLDEFISFLQWPMVRGLFRKDSNLVSIELWYQDGFSDMCVISLDPKRDRIYVAWKGAPKDDPEAMFILYGAEPLDEFKQEALSIVSGTWGHAFNFWIDDGGILGESKRK
jgi:hypothetical protein